MDSSQTFEVFFDGECPLCRREIAFLRRLDRKGRVCFTDIAAAGFDPTREGLPPWHDLMARIHGRELPSGRVVEGVDVFRALYAAVGFGPIVALTRARPIAAALELGYSAFAARRLRLTGRCDDRCAVEPRAEVVAT